MTDGSRLERKLVRAFRDCGYGAVRTPTSGSGTDADLPDVLAASRVDVEGMTGPIATYADALAIEVKSTSETTAYAAEGEIEALGRFAYAFGAIPYIAAWFKRSGGNRSAFYVCQPGDCRVTDGGRYGVPEADAEYRAAMVVYPSTEQQEAYIERDTPDPLDRTETEAIAADLRGENV